jgi:hypothetical protein
MAGYIDATDENGRLVFGRGIEGPVVMLNLLRFAEIADYSAFPELAPRESISGAGAYRRYMAHTTPFLHAAGGSVRFIGEGGHPLIGPTDERWDLVLLVNYPELGRLVAMSGNADYLAGIGHRTAALEDSRLVPLVAIGD